MKRFRKKSIEVDAVQITDSTFDAPRPNPEHVPGVTYDPRMRRIRLDVYGQWETSRNGEWIVRDEEGNLTVWTNSEFREQFEEVDG